jgi:uncharacterized protein (TIGR03437 family)
VTSGGVSTSKVLTWVTKYAPGAFTYAQNGTTFAIATRADGAPLNPSSPAQPGDVITIYASGLEPSTAGVISPARKTVDNVQVSIGGQQATVQYAGLVAAGVFQINIVVPAVAPGNQPLLIVTNYIPSPGGVSLPIAASATASQR